MTLDRDDIRAIAQELVSEFLAVGLLINAADFIHADKHPQLLPFDKKKYTEALRAFRQGNRKLFRDFLKTHDVSGLKVG